MANYNWTARQAAQATALGVRVDKATTAIVAHAANTTMFNVEGGAILVTQLIGLVTVDVAAGANATKVVSNPDTGSDSDICATLDIDGHVAGTIYTVNGTAATALQTSATGEGACIGTVTPFVVQPGTIEQDAAAAATGNIHWILFYVPLEEGAYVTSA